MSTRVMPFLLFNLGGEMMYVVYDRLRVQLHNKTITQAIANQGVAVVVVVVVGRKIIATHWRAVRALVGLIQLRFHVRFSANHMPSYFFRSLLHHIVSYMRSHADLVLSDISKIMFNKDFVGEMFRPQDVYKPDVLRALFDKLVNASIMRINHESFDKVWYGMVWYGMVWLICCIDSSMI